MQLQDWWKRESAECLMMHYPVHLFLSCNTKCSVSVLCCCKDKIPLLQRLKSQDRSSSTCLFATTKINIFCSFELLCILHSVTWDSHKAVMWYMCESYEQFQRQKANELCRSSSVLCPWLPLTEIFLEWGAGISSVCKTMQ